MSSYKNVQPAVDVQIVKAKPTDIDRVIVFLEPFMKTEQILPRTKAEITKLCEHAFVALVANQVVGFASVEIYSLKLAEVQAMAVSPKHQRLGVGQRLLAKCVRVAADNNVKELMAISSSDEFMRSCGFDHSLPNQKRAFFVQPRRLS